MRPYEKQAPATGARSADAAMRWVRIVALLLFAAWVARYMREMEPLLHGSLLIFHEAGHVLFMPFGEFMMVLGGSLFQLMVPAGIMLYFARKRDWFAVAFTGLYLAASFDGVGVYVADARAGELELIGGERSNHDWTFLLIEMKMLDRDLLLGGIVRGAGVVLFVGSLLAGLWTAWFATPPGREPVLRSAALPPV